ncbi:MAG: hypothetical protein J6S75_11960, partial [Thermoguttaceae bacterium]|nr:hypothetical protein [Thermoguttaceae bacterium]
FSTNERVKEEACLQIDSALNAQVSMTRRYEEYQLANLNNTYQFQRQSVRLGRQLEQGTITQEEYLAGYQSASAAAESRQSRLMRRYNADKITITERMVLAKHNSAERIELGFIQDYNDYQKHLCDAYGLCLKAENNADAAQTNANSAADGLRTQTLNSAQAALESAQNSAYYTYLSTALGAESNALYANDALLTSRASALIGEYLTSAAALCENMGTAAGDFYADVCACLENYYNAEETALSALNTALRAKSSALTSSYIALESAYTGSVSSAIWNCANTVNAASLAASLVDPTYQNERIDAQVAYSKALEQARADEQTTIVRAAFEYHRTRTSFDADTARWINIHGPAAIIGPNGCLSVNTYYLSDFTSTYYLYYDSQDRSYYYLDDSMFPPTALYGYLQGYENGNSMALSDYMYTSSFAGVSLTINSPVALGAVSQDQWNQITGAAYTLRNLKQGAAAAKRQADEAAAWYDYVADYTAICRDQAADELAAYQTSVQTELSAGQTLQTAYWDAVVTASTALNSALGAADSTGLQLDYLANTVTNQNTLDLGLTGAFGRFQTGWRQERLNSLDVDSPYYTSFASDLSQISQISGARNNACAQDILAREGFYDTIYDELNDYFETDLDESAAYLSRLVSASRTFSQTQYSLAAAYV